MNKVLAMIFKSTILLSLLLLSNQVISGHFKLDKTIIESSTVSFIPHSGVGEWDNYLTMNLPFEPVADLFKQLLVKKATQLTSRGEAHITILTPVEYWNILKPVGITMDEINELAIKAKIQNLRFKPLCMGRGSALVDGEVEKTFYIVVESADALRMRKALKKLYVSRGGDEKKFDPTSFYPHITVGFTKRDLHASDKVIKNKKSCVFELDLI